MEIETRLQNAFSKAFKRRVVYLPTLSMKDNPKWDSLKHVTFMVELEKEFGIRVNGSEAAHLVSIPDIKEFLQKRLSDG